MTREIALACAAAACLSIAPAQAGDMYENPISARVLEGWVMPDGTRMSALQLTLDPGWKTYWRAPGDAGIPPEFDWRPSLNLQGVTVTWPTPEVFHENGMRSIGYQQEVIIPLAIAPGSGDQPVQLRGEMHIGVCSDVCMPHTLHFDTIIKTAETAPTPAIAAALAQRPYSAGEAGVTAATCRIEPIADGLRIEARIDMPSAGGTEEMVIEPGQMDIWVSEPKTHRSGGTLIATSDLMHVSGGPFALDRSDIRLTVIGSAHAVDILGCSPG
jgi:DsbC/DsbD-like thiol-disulfide interchange protein